MRVLLFSCSVELCSVEDLLNLLVSASSALYRRAAQGPRPVVGHPNADWPVSDRSLPGCDLDSVCKVLLYVKNHNPNLDANGMEVLEPRCERSEGSDNYIGL